ncbi:MAG: HAD hydrolase family protein, partial [Verrucomicrobiae bacterium]|nr:HAD hydrolase family protein [Verrucomicrobiae bacterium]
PPRSVPPVLPDLLRHAPRIVYNGAQAIVDDQVVYARPLPADDVRHMLEWAESSGERWYIGLEIDDTLYVNRNFPKPGHFEVADLMQLWKQPTYKMIFFFPEGRGDIEPLLAAVPPTTRSLVTPKFDIVQLCAASADKSTALDYLLSQQGRSLDMAVAIGDDINDVEMVRCSGVGVAVENALPEVKAVADWIVPDNNRHGQGSGRTSVHELLAAHPDPADAQAEAEFAAEFRRRAFRWAADPGFRQTLLGFILLLGVTAALLALADRLMPSDSILGIRATRHPSHWGAFVSRNHLANYLNFAALIGLGLFLRHSFPRSGHRPSRLKGLLALGGALVCVGGTLSTVSKGGLLSLAAGLAAFTALLLARKRSRVQLRIMIFGALLLAALTLVYARPSVQRAEEWFSTSWGGEQEARWSLWREAWSMGRAMKGRGIGAGAFETVFPAWQISNGRKIASHAENEYLQMIVEWGPAAATAWLATGVLLLLRATKTFRGNAAEWQVAGWAALTGMAVHAAVDFPFHMPANAWVACALLGVLLRGHAEDERESGGDPSSAPRRLDRLRLSVAALLLAVGSVLGFADLFAPLRRAHAALE